MRSFRIWAISCAPLIQVLVANWSSYWCYTTESIQVTRIIWAHFRWNSETWQRETI